MLVSRAAELRPTPEQIQQLQYFQDFGVKTLQKLDSQFQLDNLQKSQFYKGLTSVLPQLPTRILVHRVYPCLAKEFPNASMVPFLLPSVFHIIERCNEEDFRTHILPSLIPVMQLMEPVQILLLFMQNMTTLLDKTPASSLNTDVLPMLYRALDGQDPQLQELCLSILPQFSDRLDATTLRTGLVPRIKRLCSGTRLLSVRVKCLVCVGKMLEHMDKWQVVDEVVPMVIQLPSREPAIVMAAIGILRIAINNSKLGLSKEIMANKVLPFLIPLSIENSLSLSQFESIMELIKDMTTRVEKDQRSRLQQMVAAKEERQQPQAALAPANSAQLTNSTSSSSFTGFGDQEQPPEVKALSNSTTSLSLEDKQRLFRGQEETRKGTSSTSNMDFGEFSGSGTQAVTSSGHNNNFQAQSSYKPMSFNSNHPMTSGYSASSSTNNSKQPTNPTMMNNAQTQPPSSALSNHASFQKNAPMMMMHQGIQPNVNFSSLPSQYMSGVAAGALTPGGGAGAGAGIRNINNNNNTAAILMPSNSVQAHVQQSSGANSLSTKQLSMAEINDLLS
eukprot:TRINITY_DN3317_c0_g1_i6.p1 TRINITY_DN3317_c0_g1~~TRINITY_DN3317_c0_g1_i6.p1  ORF type:complete len:601 (-),score=117.19 TRINITY_DN3317_c0_g1_i6:149-1828(-)